jgi:omega-6 fatty acid desaturase (delta-12 desaturase)
MADNGPQITKAIKAVLKDSYNYDSTVCDVCYRLSDLIDFFLQPTFYAFYRSFTQCLFVEDDSDIVFYKNRCGVAVREVQQAAIKELRASGWKPEEQDSLEISGGKTD